MNKNYPSALKALLLFISCWLLSGCNLTINTTGRGTVEFNLSDHKPCANQFANCTAWSTGAEVSLNPVPADGYFFHGWEGDCAGQGECTVKMSGHRQVRAVFLADESVLPAPEFKPETDHFFSAPWPNDAYSRSANGTVDLREFPFKKGTLWESRLKKLANSTRGFSTNGGTIFQMALGYSLPDVLIGSFDAAIINTDPESGKLGARIPADVNYYEAPEADSAVERSMLLVVTPQPGYPLDPETRYTVALYNSSYDIRPADLMVALDGPYSPQTNISQSLFENLKAQKQWLLSIDEREPLAFTRFTTQDPKYIDRAIGKTLSQLTSEDVLASVQSIEKIHECQSVDHTENYLLRASMPVFQKGVRPYLLSGGEIVIENGEAVIQGHEDIDILVQVPCESAPPQGFPVKVHGSETLLDWSDQFVDSPMGNQRVVQLILSAPESTSRASDLVERLDSLLATFGADEWTRIVLLGIITDFNVLNPVSAKYSHMQYGAELFYTQKLAENIDAIIQENNRLLVAPQQMILSGDSAGAIALLHARAMGAQADMAISFQAPRPSYLHISSIVDFLSVVDGIPDDFVDFLAGLTGLETENNKYQPLAHIVQTLLEPMDTLNYSDELDVPELLYVLPDYYDYLHGGEAAYSMVPALDQSLALQPVLGGDIYFHEELEPYIDLTDAMEYEDFGYSGRQRILAVVDWDVVSGYRLMEYEPHHGSRCYAFDVFRKGRPFDGSQNFSYYDSERGARLCN